MLLETIVAVSLLAVGKGGEATAERLAAEKALVERCSIRQVNPLALQTPIVAGGQARAIICCADEPAWRESAMAVRRAVREATGVELPLVSDRELTAEQFAGNNLILVGHLDNNRWVARLYHNFFVCLDQGFTGRKGYVIRTVHDPFGTHHNQILLGGSFAEGTRRAAEAFGKLVRSKAARGELVLDRLLELEFDPDQRQGEALEPLAEKQRAAAIANGRRLMLSPGQARSGVGQLIDHGVRYHRTGDPACAAVCRELLLALEEYHRTDPHNVAHGMRRYDRDFRDAYTYEVAIVWDLVEECGLFSDAERLAITNLLVRLGLECVVYQGWDRAASIERWAQNTRIVHNHLTFPALGVLFAGNYLKRHYGVGYVDDWLTVAHGIFNGQKHWSKPLEDSASYQWIPVIHTMIYSLAEDDRTFFEEGHARSAANVALMVTDNAGYQAAFGDYPALTSSSCVPPVLQVAGWYYRDRGFLWGAELAGRSTHFYVGQPYNSAVPGQAPADHVGLRVARLEAESYEAAKRTPKGEGPNLPLAQVFDKLTLRAGWQRGDEFLMLDGFGRGNHMHFDVNAIVSYSAGGWPLLVDGEYIKSMPKYHNSLVVLRDGAAEPAPAVAGLARAEDFGGPAYARTWVEGYSGARWTRTLLWQPGDCLLVADEALAQEPGRYTLRCCWRPWGLATLAGDRLDVTHGPVRLTLVNGDGAPCTLETMKKVDDLPVSRLAQQVSLDLTPGQSYRFVNLLRAEPSDGKTPLAARRIAPDAFVLQRGPRSDVAAFGPGETRLPGVDTDAEFLLLGAGRLLAVGVSRLACGQDVLRADAPVSLALDFSTRRGRLIATAPARLTLRVGPRCLVRLGDKELRADESGNAVVSAAAGSTPIELAAATVPAWLAEAHGRLVALPGAAARSTSTDPAAVKLAAAWKLPGLEPPLEKTPVKSLQSSIPTAGSYKLENLTDGTRSGSISSALWARGKNVTITAELPEAIAVRGVALYEWQGNPGWGIGRREVELSCDGFQKDVRRVRVTFQPSGRFGSPECENVRMEAALRQQARQVRITLTPASAKQSCYLSELEVLAVPAGKRVPLNALAAGDLDGDGRQEIVMAGESGRIMAVTDRGQARWTYDTESASPVDALACADVDGDGRAEVLFGGRSARLGLLGGDGRLRWQATPPRYRGLPSDVKTVFPGDVDGDGRPEILCGALSWQYFAYDRAGQMLWSSVIYAHSATVGCACDLDGDGRQEIIAGNAYYQLNALRPDGRRLWVAGTTTPEMTAVAAGNVDAGPQPEVLCGMDGGDLFAFDGAGKPLWRTNLGDRVNRILLVNLDADPAQEIVCAADSASVVALKGDGRVLWRSFLPGGCSDLAVQGQGSAATIAAAAGPAGFVLLDARGHIHARAATAAKAERLVLAGPQAVVATQSGEMEAFGLPTTPFANAPDR